MDQLVARADLLQALRLSGAKPLCSALGGGRLDTAAANAYAQSEFARLTSSKLFVSTRVQLPPSPEPYVLLACTFEAGQFARFAVHLYSDAAVALGVALRIAWRTLTFAGLRGADRMRQLERILRAERAGKGIFAPKALSPAMAAFTGKKSLPRTEVVKAIWKYIKAKSLNKGRIISPDATLKTIIPVASVDMLKMASYVSKHLS